jgi:hypothetical protein
MLSPLLKMSKKAWLKVALIILFITVLRTMVQPFIPESGPSPFPKSAFVEAGLLPIAFVIYGIVMLGLLAVVFLLLQDRLPGTRLVKGLTFGLSFGLLWFVYLLEPLPHGSWQIPSCLYYPVIDGITVASLGVLLGLFVATDSKKAEKSAGISTGTIALLAIPLLFLAGRLLSYNIFHIYSSYDVRLFDTLLWGIVLGLWTAVMYLVLRPGIALKSPLAKAAFFGILVFGINIFLNDMFMPIPFDMQLWGLGTFTYEDMIVRTLTDVIFVTAGVFVYEKISRVFSGDSQTGTMSSA